jgi:ribosomal protein L40E
LRNYSFLIILSVLVFFFVALPALLVSVGLGVLFWLLAVGMFLWGVVGRNNEIKEERIRKRAELEEEGRQRAVERFGSRPEQIVKETVVTREVVLIQCRHCGARYPQGTPKCFTCGANL